MDTNRRRFLRNAPLAAAAAALPLAELRAAAQPATTEAFKLVPASEFAEQAAALRAHPGNFNFFDSPHLPFTCVMTVETAKAAKEFEWHEGRDHILQILDGETEYEVGGMPENGRNTKPGEWLAPASKGATKMTLRKGDILIIPRNTPHKRTTTGSVTLYLFSTTGDVKS